jgi:hypothetical protein
MTSQSALPVQNIFVSPIPGLRLVIIFALNCVKYPLPSQSEATIG